MNDENLKKLTQELKAEGALEKEADELAFLSKNLSNLYSFERSENAKIKFLRQNYLPQNKFFISKQMFITAFLSLILLVGFTSVVGAQNSLPGDTLYPVKIASENIASFINPSFKNEIITRRSEEIKELSSKKDGDKFRNTVNEYEKELKENKKIDLKNIEESRRNLEEAQENSLEEHKKDLERVIIKTENKQEEIKKEDEDNNLNSPEDNIERDNEDNRDSEDHPRF